MSRALWIGGAGVALLGGLIAVRFRQEATAADGQPKGGPGGAAGGAPGGGGGGNRAASVEVEAARPGTIETILDTVGNLESRDRADLAPRTTGRILMLSVREGDRVRAGQLLVQLDDGEIKAQISQAQSDVAEARARLAQAQLGQNPNQTAIESAIAQQTAAVESARAEFDQVRQTVSSQVASVQADVDSASARLRSATADQSGAVARQNQAQANLKNAENRAQRVESLLAQGFASRQQAEDARTSADVARGNLEVAQADVQSAEQDVISAKANLEGALRQLEIAKKRVDADVRAARARLYQAEAALRTARANTSQTSAYRQNMAALQASVDAAEARLRQAQSRTADTSLRAPFSGVVTARRGDPGSLASPGAAVLSIQGDSVPQVRVSIPARAAGEVYVGQRAEFELEGASARPFPGRLTHLNAVADPTSRQISALVQLDAPDKSLRPGLFGKVRLVLGTVTAAVTVPREAVRNGREGATVAVVGPENKAEVRSVKLGAQDPKRVQLLEGVRAGEKVVTLTFSPVRDGQSLQLPGSRGGGNEKGSPARGGRP